MGLCPLLVVPFSRSVHISFRLSIWPFLKLFMLWIFKRVVKFIPSFWRIFSKVVIPCGISRKVSNTYWCTSLVMLLLFCSNITLSFSWLILDSSLSTISFLSLLYLGQVLIRLVEEWCLKLLYWCRNILSLDSLLLDPSKELSSVLLLLAIFQFVK